MSAGGQSARVAALVLNYNGAADTLACLESVARMTPTAEIVQVIDNASSDDSVARIRQAFPGVPIRIHARNLGFGAGHNPVLRELIDAGFDWIWLLNNDARATPDALARMLETAGDDVGVLGARIVDPDPPHALQAFGGGHLHAWRGSASECRTERPSRPLDYITGASMLLNSQALREVGLFDPRFFLYWEDVDLCLRLRAAGWRLRVAGHAEIRHHQSAVAGRETAAKDRLINASTVRFFRKHGRLGGWPALAIGTSARVARRLARLRVGRAAAVIAGTLEGLRG